MMQNHEAEAEDDDDMDNIDDMDEMNDDDMDDERQLATLVVLLLRHPPITPNDTDDDDDDHKSINSNTNKARAGHGEEEEEEEEDESPKRIAAANPAKSSPTPPPPSLKSELEKDRCRLSCFVGRLIHGYVAARAAIASATVTRDDDDDDDDDDASRTTCDEGSSPNIQDAYLKLAVRILYLRYHHHHHHHHHNNNNTHHHYCDHHDNHHPAVVAATADEDGDEDGDDDNKRITIQNHEEFLFHLLLRAFQTRCAADSEQVDVEMAWTLHDLSLRLSTTTTSTSVPSFWVSLTNVLLVRRRRRRRCMTSNGEGEMGKRSGKNGDGPTAALAQTIHSIVDHHSHRVLGVPIYALPVLTSDSTAAATNTASAVANEKDDGNGEPVHANNHKADENNEINNPTNERNVANNRRCYWNDLFDAAIVSSLQSFLRVFSSPCCDTSVSLLSRQALVELILWSQTESVCCADDDADGDGDGEVRRRRWRSQLSVDIHHLTLQYLRQCCHRHRRLPTTTAPSKTLSSSIKDSSSSSSSSNDPYRLLNEMCVARDTGDSNSRNANHAEITNLVHAIRSFVFYGLLVLSNDRVIPRPVRQLDTHADIDIEKSREENAYGSHSRHAHVLRCEIYGLISELWQSIGPEWLYLSPNCSELFASTSTAVDGNQSSLWWLSSTSLDQTRFAKQKGQKDFNGNSNEKLQQLGNTWPLCMLIRLAAGEFRLHLGNWLDRSLSETKNDKSVVNGIESYATIVAQAVQLMTSLAGDEDDVSHVMVTDGKHSEVWTPNSILHVRHSLEDALNSSIQFFVTVSDGPYRRTFATENVNFTDVEGVTRTCSMVLGTIASELEMDYLLSISGCSNSKDDTNNKNIGSENLKDEATDFAIALRSALSLCHALGEARFRQELRFEETKPASQMEEYEPLVYLLPCIMSIAATITSDPEDSNEDTIGKASSALAFLSEDGFLVNLISRFFHRMLEYWNSFIIPNNEIKVTNDSVVSSRANTTLSLVRMCAALMEMLLLSESWFVSDNEIRMLYDSLHVWSQVLSARSQQLKFMSVVDLKNSFESTLDQTIDCLTLLKRFGD